MCRTRSEKSQGNTRQTGFNETFTLKWSSVRKMKMVISLKFKNIILNVKRSSSLFLVNKSKWFLIAKETCSYFDQIRLWVSYNRISNMPEYLVSFMPRKESNAKLLLYLQIFNEIWEWQIWKYVIFPMRL